MEYLKKLKECEKVANVLGAALESVGYDINSLKIAEIQRKIGGKYKTFGAIFREKNQYLYVDYDNKLSVPFDKLETFELALKDIDDKVNLRVVDLAERGIPYSKIGVVSK